MPSFHQYLDAVYESLMPVTEKVVLRNPDFLAYAKIVATAYAAAPVNDPKAHPAYRALNESNYAFWRRLLTRVQIECTTEDRATDGKVFTIDGKKYTTRFLGAQPYDNAAQMSADVKQTGVLKISVDYSNHPFFSVEDNIVFRSVHDYIVHIEGGKPFGLKGEIQAYNLHAKLVPEVGKPAIFTEVVGQACYHEIYNKFPEQKCAILPGFDYTVVGVVYSADGETATTVTA